MLCDQPFATRDIIAGLVRAHRETNCCIVASSYGNSYGVPALFSSIRYTELRALEGTAGAKQVIAKHLPKVHLLSPKA
jgi:molybdenum cofactor cytidylyltransferase